MPSSERDKRLRAELAAELGWYPADLDDESIARHRADAARKKTDRDPAKKWAHLTELARQREAGVLAPVIHAALVGDHDGIPVVERAPALADVSRELCAARFAAYGKFIRGVNERVAPLIRVMEQSASGDPALGDAANCGAGRAPPSTPTAGIGSANSAPRHCGPACQSARRSM